MKKTIRADARHFDSLITFIFSYVGGHLALAVFDQRDISNLVRDLPCIFEGMPNASNAQVRIRHKSILDCLKRDVWPQEIELEMIPLKNRCEALDLPYVVSVTKDVSALQIQSSYIYFYELILHDIKSKFSSDCSNWPDLLNFGRIIRNAFAHGGKINFTNPSASSVTWKKLTYSPADNGRQVIFNDLATADIIVLMDEIASAL